MADHMPLVSVVLRTYNRAHLLPQSLDSVLEQDYPRFEVIVVDDCSPDETPELIRERYADRVRYIRLGENQGISVVTNTGIRAAEGELIAFHDDDDIWLPGKLTAQVEALHEHPECALAYGKALVVDPDGQPTGGTFGSSGRGRTGDNFGLMLHCHPLVDPCVMVRRQVLEEVGLCDEELQTAQDTDLFLRITLTHPAVYVDRPLILVREHPGRKTTGERTSGKMARNYVRVYRKLWDLLPPERERFRGMVALYIVQNEFEVARLGRKDYQPLDDCLQIMKHEPELFDDYLAFHGIAASILRFSDQPQLDMERVADAARSQASSSCCRRRKTSMLFTTAARAAFRETSPFLAAKYAVRAISNDPPFVISTVLARIAEAVTGRYF